MILGLMRKHAKSWIIKFMIAVICIVFVLYFGYTFRAQRGLRIAKVNGEVITRAEYQNEYRRLYDMFKRMYGDAWNESLAKALNLRQIALRNLIDQRIMAQEARRLGIRVSVHEIQEEILRYPAFQRNGRFDIRLYKMLLRDNGIEPKDFEKAVAQQILANKLKEFILSFMDVTDKEAYDYFLYKNKKIRISYVLFRPERYKKDVKVDEKMIRDFFKKHKERYRVPERIRCAYIVIDPKDFEDKVKLTEKDIQEYYNFHMDEYKLPGEKEPPPLKDIRDKVIRDLVEERSRELAQEKGYELIDKMPYDISLEEYAKENGLKVKYTDYFSLDDNSIPGIGGDKKIIAKLFELKGKDVSDLLLIKGKYYIFQVSERKPSFIPKLESVYEDVKEDLINELAMERAKEEARKFLKEVSKDDSLKDMAKKMGLEIKYTDFFSRSDPIPDIGGNQDLKEELFSLDKRHRYPKDIYSNYDGAYVIRWEGEKEPDKREFEKNKYKIKLEISYLKRDMAFNSWLNSLRKSAKIEILNPVE